MGRLYVGLDALDARDWPKAEALFREVVGAARDPQLLAFAYIGLAASLHHAGQTPEAIEAFGEASRLLQGIPSGHVYLAQNLEQIGDREGAWKLLARGMEEDPDNGVLLLYAIEFLQRSGREADARAVQQEVLGRGRLPADAFSLRKFGEGLIRIKEFELAVRAFRQLLEVDPDNVDAPPNLAGFLNMLGRPREAEPHARKAVELKPDHHLGHGLLGWTLHGQQRWAEAERSLRTAMKLRPDVPDHMMLLGDTLRRLKQLDEAEELLRKGLKIKPRDAQGHYWLGEVLRELQREKEAEEMFRKARELQQRKGP
jgi:tetratricopeptide (TPR) repeat protein